ncbi:MAG TPA: PKD domain-containing protein [Marmoricola sp.]|nr:PKD domain-containing protein [Marmoricola sp.]
MKLHKRAVVGATITGVVAALATMPAQAPANAAVNSVPGTVVKSTALTSWTPNSPDPAGITYLSDTGKLLVSDSEVDEMPLYAGVNLWTSTYAGVGSASGTTETWSYEPTGVAYDAAGKRLFVSDDDQDRIYQIDGAGADGLFGTADDGPRSFFKASTFGSTDTEDVAYDSTHDQLLIINGLADELYRVDPGPDGDFSTTADNVVTHTDVGHLGAVDPQAVAYDPVRDTILVADDTHILELGDNGSLMNVITLPNQVFTISGITVAPASSGTGRSYYLTDRGKDNNPYPSENDGRLLEVSATLPPVTNQPPTASAGPDQIVQLPDVAQLSGSATDDGKPAPLTYTWTKTSGPGAVSFGNPNAAKTTASFSIAGTYVLRLTASDSDLSDYDELTVSVYTPGQTRSVNLPIAASTDDAQEGGGQYGDRVQTDSPDDELGNNGEIDPYTQQLTTMLTGLRFAGLPVPKGSKIVSARIQFTTDETGSDPASFTIRGEAADNAATYAATRGNISKRAATAASAPWAPGAWTTVAEAGTDQLTPDLSAIVQQVVDRAGWQQGNAVAFMISGSGRRTAGAYDGPWSAPVLQLQFQPPNTAPVVNAGADQTVNLPAGADLSATVTDDGLPNPPGATTVTWSKVSGPGTVTFSDPQAATTTATFSQGGVYVLQVLADDGALQTTDTVGVTVNEAPKVEAGPDQAVQIPAPAVLDGKVTGGFPAATTASWTTVSGPGSVTFADHSAPSTEATFSEAGQYVLRLTATNSAGLSGSDDVVVDVTGPALAVDISPSSTSLVAGRTVKLTGTVVRTANGVPVAGVPVTVWAYRAPDYQARKLGVVTTAADGSFWMTDRPQVVTRYVAMTDQGVSTRVTVRVRPRLGAHLTDATVRRDVRTWVRGVVAPSAAGQPIWLQRWNGSRWGTVARTTTAKAAQARFSFPVKVHRTGTYRYRVLAPAYAGRLRAVTPTMRLSVRR